MTHPLDAATEAPPSRKSRRAGWRAVQVAPGPQAPDVRDKDARRRGMILALVGAVVFWATVAAGVLYFVNR